MSDSVIQLSPDSTGKKVDTEELTVGVNTVHRERMQIAGDSATDIAPVTAADGLLVNLGVNNDVTVAALPLPTGAATSALQLPNSHDVTVDNAAGAAAVNIQDGGNTITVDGTVAVSGTVDTELPAAAALADNTANPTVPAVGAFGQVWDGATWDRTPGNAADGTLVNLGANNDVSLNAGTNNIGDVDIASLPDEGQQTMANSISVAIASDQSTVPVSLASGGTTQYAEDSAHVTGDLVTLAGVVQQSADAALSTDGDRSLLQVDSSGFLKVNIKAGAGSGGTAMADDAAFTPAVTQGTPAFAFADETTPDSVDEGDAGALRMTLDRKLLTRVVGATDANRLDVDGSGHAQVDIAAASVTVPVSAVSLPLPTGASTAANQSTEIASLAAIETDADAIRIATQLIDDTVQVLGTDVYTEATSKAITLGAVRRDADTTLVGTTNEFGPLQMDANGRLKVEVFSGETLPVSGTVAVSSLPALVAGTANIGDVDVLSIAAGDNNIGNVDVVTLPALVAGTANIGDVDIASGPTGASAIQVQGTAAHDVATAGNPVLNGAQMETMADSAPGTRAGTDGDAVKLASTDGALFVITTGPQTFTYHDDDVAAVTTDGTVHAAPGAGLSLYVTDIAFSIGAATASSIFFEESTTKVLGPYYLEAINGRGLAIKFQTPKKITANTALLVTNTGAITFSVDVQGFIAPG